MLRPATWLLFSWVLLVSERYSFEDVDDGKDTVEKTDGLRETRMCFDEGGGRGLEKRS